MSQTNAIPFNLSSITKAQFEAYCEGPFRSMLLNVFSLNLGKKSNKLKQGAALSLGFNAYESLVELWDRCERIKNGIHLEACFKQDDRFTLKAKNILFVYDPVRLCFVGMALRPGEEGRKLDASLADLDEVCIVEMPEGAVFSPNVSKKRFHAAVDGGDMAIDDIHSGSIQGPLQYTIVTDNGVEIGEISVTRTDEGIILDVYEPGDESEVFSSGGIMFTDRQESEGSEDLVNLVDMTPLFSGAYGEYYSWYKSGADDQNLSRLLSINPGEETDISDFMYETPERAIECVQNEEWGVDPEQMREVGGFLVKHTLTLVPSPY